jgi:hypothetical protein
MSWTARTAAFALLVSFLLLGYAHNFLVGPDDDRLWLYTAGIGLGRGEEAEQLNRRVYESIDRLARPDSQRVRFALREGYERNYVGAAVVHGAAAAAVRRQRPELASTDYPAFLARAMFASFASMYALSCLVLLAVVFILSDRRSMTAVVLAVATIGLMESVFDLAGDTWAGLPTLLPDAQTQETYWQNIWPNLPALFVNPQIQLSPFGDTPRNHFILLMLPLFLLRWTGRISMSYLFLAALGFLHQSHTGLVLAYLVAVDAVLRPAVFRGWTALVMAVILAMFVGRESLGAMIGVARPIVIVAGAVAVLAIAGCLYWGLRGRITRVMEPLSRLRQRLLDRGDAFADLAMLGIILAASFPVVAVINELGTEAQSLYFWSQVHGRSLGILRPALMLGLAFLVVRRLDVASGEQPTTSRILAFAAIALLPGIVEASRLDRHPVARIERHARALDGSIGPAIDWASIAARSEPEIYYAIARTMDIGR